MKQRLLFMDGHDVMDMESLACTAYITDRLERKTELMGCSVLEQLADAGYIIVMIKAYDLVACFFDLYISSRQSKMGQETKQKNR